MTSVTDMLNKAHLRNDSTIGAPTDIPLYGNPLVPSINFSTAYAFDTVEDLGAYHNDKFNSIRYTRDSSLLVRQLESYFSVLHNDYKTLIFNSGMSALSGCFNSLLDKNSVILTVGSFYRKCNSIFDDVNKRFGIENINYPDIETLVEDNANSSNAIILLESPANPFLDIYDIKKVRDGLPDAKIVYDTTFQGLRNGVDLYQYADYIVMSCTKYIGGHNDVLGGVVACRTEEFYADLWDQRSMRGGIIDNFSAYLLLRSLRTYDLRIERSLENVEVVLDYLSKSPKVTNIYYPGRFENEPQKEIFDRSFRHGGAVITFRVDDKVSLKENMASLYSTKMAPSFGSVDSLIEIPKYMSHWGKSDDDLAKLGLDAFTVRYSVGNEPSKYLIDDLERLLGRG